MNPLISVIVPVYNTEPYLRECLDSISNQTLKDIEIICVDDGSSDNSIKILKEYEEKDNRFTILTQNHLKAGVARNNGIKIAKGEYLCFLDSDDFFDLNMLEEMYNQGKKDNSDIVVCGYKIFNQKTKKITKEVGIGIEYKSPVVPENIKDDLFTFHKPNPWTKIFKRSLFTDNNLQFEDLLCCNDITCVCTAFALASKISIKHKNYINYRINLKSNLTATRNKHFDCFILAINKLKQNLIKFNKLNMYKSALLKRFKSSLKYELSKCSPQEIKEHKALLKKLLDKDLYKDAEKIIKTV